MLPNAEARNTTPPAERLLFSQSFRIAAKRGREARRLTADGGHEAAIEIWSAVFGEPFPAPSPSPQTLSALTAGSTTSTGHAVTSQSGTQTIDMSSASRISC
jgi:hypothetical protein